MVHVYLMKKKIVLMINMTRRNLCDTFRQFFNE